MAQPAPLTPAASLLRVVLILAATVGVACGQLSDSVRLIELEFNAVPYPNNTLPTPPPQVSEPCPLTIHYKSIERYRGINPSDLNGEYDGILWKNLLVNGGSCKSTPSLNTATYFTIPYQPPPGQLDPGQPWFLVGRDNAMLSCDYFQAKLPAFHRFTDDLPTYKDYLIQQQLLRKDHVPNPFRGDIYLFLVFERNDSFVRDPNVCLFQAGPYVPGPEEGGNDDPSPSEPPEEGGPACLSARMHVQVRSAGPDHEAEWTSKRVSDLRVGDVLKSQTGEDDPIISFSDFDHDTVARFVSLDIRPHPLSAVNEGDSARLITNVTTTLELSDGHLVHMYDGTSKAARFVIVGDNLLAQHNPFAQAMQVVQVRTIIRRGVYAPLTLSATLSVHGAIISCYTDAVFGAVEGHALSAPVRASWHIFGAVDWCDTIQWLRRRVWG